jgi:transcriptional regulator with XRE-family HTH domain
MTDLVRFATANPELFAAQLRAARALLDWSQGYLAEGIGVSRSTIADIEAKRRSAHPATLFVLISELTAAGVEFTELGVRFRQFPPEPYIPTNLRSEG